VIRIEREMRVERPRDAVFAYLADPTRIPEWQATAVEVVRDAGTDVGVGTRWRETRVFMGKRIEQTVETTKYQPVDEFALAVVDGPIPLRIHHRLADDDGATLISVAGEGEPGGMFRFGARFIVPVVERQFDEDFARLRALLERGS
jgi:ligand-binding SRPBCC domain-containing protein